MAGDFVLDAVIIGGGPAGLTAATYLSRFRRHVLIVDSGKSRARFIPLSRNCAGFPEGIGGIALLERMRTQAQRYGATISAGEILGVAMQADRFVLSGPEGTIHARAVLLASGVLDSEPPVENHDQAVASSLLRYCPVCDGFEAAHADVAVLGEGKRAVDEALFLKTYTDRVTVVPARRMTLGTRDKDRLAAANIRVLQEIPTRIVAEPDSITTEFASGPRRFDCLYTALGCRPQTKSVAGLGVRLSKAGCVVTGKHQETAAPGLFAAGDVVESLDQISVAVGQAAIAATALHNYLRQRE